MINKSKPSQIQDEDLRGFPRQWIGEFDQDEVAELSVSEEFKTSC